MSKKEILQTIHSLPLLPLKNVVILPKSIIPVIVGRPSSIAAVENALQNGKSIFITAQKHAEVEHPQLDDIFQYGTRSTILQVMRMPKGTLKILAEGICRAKILKMDHLEDYSIVDCEDIKSIGLESSIEIDSMWKQLNFLYSNYAQLNSKAPADLMQTAKSIDEMESIADTIAVHINLSFDERQSILEITDFKDRVIKLCIYLQREIDILETDERIKNRIQTQVEKNQREYYLNEQIKAIQKELGRDELSGEIASIRAKLKNLGLSQEAFEKVEKELKRLEQMPPSFSEAVVSRNYVDWIISIPWKKTSKDNISIIEAENILNAHHSGLKKVKERIIEFIAAKKFSKFLERSPIICLVGPPGVGKTSLAKSIADSLEREFVRISLGGIRDEAEIRGHRRTYIGSQPGKIIQAMKKAKTVNPVILLDEIDKMSNDFHGDPSAALLEVLDPEQNNTFVDHFLEVDYNLRKVMFIATANHIDGIPLPLFDRMEIIRLAGYTEDEKLEISKNFLVPKNLNEYSLKPKQFIIPDEILLKVITEHTKESGVRQLERLIAKLMRKSIQMMLEDSKIKSVTINNDLIKKWLGYPKFKKVNLDQESDRIGLANGLAWTEVGGDILEIEVSVVSGKGGLTLTGQLGEVMQESAQAALSYIRSKAKELGLKDNFHANKDLHVHIPEGATPKDGPSAGITMCTALISAITKNPMQSNVAMTGEITLRGRVLAVGGLKEKLLAAKQYAMKTVIVPEENKEDIEEFISEIDSNNSLNVIFVNNMDQVLKAALTNDPFFKKKRDQERKN